MKYIRLILNNQVLQKIGPLEDSIEFPVVGDLLRLSSHLYVVKERLWALDTSPQFRTIHLHVELAPDEEDR